MKVVKGIWWISACSLLYVYAMSWAGSLLSMDSDIAVIAGWALVMVLVSSFIVGANKGWERIRSKHDEKVD